MKKELELVKRPMIYDMILFKLVVCVFRCLVNVPIVTYQLFIQYSRSRDLDDDQQDGDEQGSLNLSSTLL